MKFLFNKKAFTLAETLIVLVIIGVIAAMTIPSVVAKYQKMQTEVGLKKAYNELQKAINLSELENGSHTEWDYGLGSVEFIDKYLKSYVKIKNEKTYKALSKIQYKNLKGTKLNTGDYSILGANGVGSGKNTASFTTLDGAVITVDNWFPDDKSFKGFAVDINGPNKPNIAGKDYFEFFLMKNNGLQAETTPKTLVEAKEQCYYKGDRGQLCALVIMKSGWKIPDDYPW